MMENDIASLPLRWLPPGCVSALFMMYLAFCRSAADQERVPASKSTFLYCVSKMENIVYVFAVHLIMQYVLNAVG